MAQVAWPSDLIQISALDYDLHYPGRVENESPSTGQVDVVEQGLPRWRFSIQVSSMAKDIEEDKTVSQAVAAMLTLLRERPDNYIELPLKKGESRIFRAPFVEQPAVMGGSGNPNGYVWATSTSAADDSGNRLIQLAIPDEEDPARTGRGRLVDNAQVGDFVKLVDANINRLVTLTSVDSGGRYSAIGIRPNLAGQIQYAPPGHNSYSTSYTRLAEPDTVRVRLSIASETTSGTGEDFYHDWVFEAEEYIPRSDEASQTAIQELIKIQDLDIQQGEDGIIPTVGIWHDPLGEPIAIDAEPSSDGLSWDSSDTGITVTGERAGVHSIIVYGYPTRGREEVRQEAVVRVRPRGANRPPQAIASVPEVSLTIRQSQTDTVFEDKWIEFAGVFQDLDGDSITLIVEVLDDPGAVRATPDGSRLYLKAAAPGEGRIRVRAQDASGESSLPVTFAFSVARMVLGGTGGTPPGGGGSEDDDPFYGPPKATFEPLTLTAARTNAPSIPEIYRLRDYFGPDSLPGGFSFVEQPPTDPAHAGATIGNVQIVGEALHVYPATVNDLPLNANSYSTNVDVTFRANDGRTARGSLPVTLNRVRQSQAPVWDRSSYAVCLTSEQINELQTLPLETWCYSPDGHPITISYDAAQLTAARALGLTLTPQTRNPTATPPIPNSRLQVTRTRAAASALASATITVTATVPTSPLGPSDPTTISSTLTLTLFLPPSTAEETTDLRIADFDIPDGEPGTTHEVDIVISSGATPPVQTTSGITLDVQSSNGQVATGAFGTGANARKLTITRNLDGRADFTVRAIRNGEGCGFARQYATANVATVANAAPEWTSRPVVVLTMDGMTPGPAKRVTLDDIIVDLEGDPLAFAKGRGNDTYFTTSAILTDTATNKRYLNFTPVALSPTGSRPVYQHVSAQASRGNREKVWNHIAVYVRPEDEAPPTTGAPTCTSGPGNAFPYGSQLIFSDGSNRYPIQFSNIFGGTTQIQWSTLEIEAVTNGEYVELQVNPNFRSIRNAVGKQAGLATYRARVRNVLGARSDWCDFTIRISDPPAIPTPRIIEIPDQRVNFGDDFVFRGRDFVSYTGTENLRYIYANQLVETLDITWTPDGVLTIPTTGATEFVYVIHMGVFIRAKNHLNDRSSFKLLINPFTS